MTWPKRVERWQTSDGDTHPSEHSARAWQRQIGAAAVATQALDAGLTLLEAIRIFRESAEWHIPFADPEMAALSGVTARSMFIVSHWQCRDTPGYSPVRFRPDGCIYVHGDAGSWSGAYGNWCTTSEVIAYANRTRERCAGSIPERAS